MRRRVAYRISLAFLIISLTAWVTSSLYSIGYLPRSRAWKVGAGRGCLRLLWPDKQFPESDKAEAGSIHMTSSSSPFFGDKRAVFAAPGIQFVHTRYGADIIPRAESDLARFCGFPSSMIGLASGTFVSIPLWIPTGVAGVLFLWSWEPRRRRRERLGLCLACGYDLRGSTDQCPECGHESEFGSQR